MQQPGGPAPFQWGDPGAALTYQFKSGASPGWATLIIRDYIMPIKSVECCTGPGSGCSAAAIPMGLSCPRVVLGGRSIGMLIILSTFTRLDGPYFARYKGYVTANSFGTSAF